MTREEMLARSAERKQFILANYETMGACEMAKRLGIAVTTTTRIMRSLGLRTDHDRRVMLLRRRFHSDEKDVELARLVREGVPMAEVIRKTGWKKGTIERRLRNLDIDGKDEWHKRNVERAFEALQRTRRERREEVNQKIAAAHRDRHRREMLRVQVGLPKETAWKVGCGLGRNRYGAMRNLVRNYDYFWFKDEPYSIYYDEQTARLPEGIPAKGQKRHCEQYFAEKWGFVFKQA